MKKVISTLAAAMMAVTTFSAFSVSAIEIAESDELSISTDTLSESITVDDVVIPAGSTAITVRVNGNTGFDSSTTKFNIGTGDVIVNNEGNPIYSVGDVLDSSLIASASNGNLIAFSTASADEIRCDGDMFTFYISSDFVGVEIVDKEMKMSKPIDNAISPMGTLYSYMIGDVNQDDIIDSTDASTILHAISVYEDTFYNDVLPVSHANMYLSTYFPDALFAESADSNKSDTITNIDASLVLKYYVNQATGSNEPVPYVGEVVYVMLPQQVNIDKNYNS